MRIVILFNLPVIHSGFGSASHEIKGFPADRNYTHYIFSTTTQPHQGQHKIKVVNNSYQYSQANSDTLLQNET